jgi:hypothetical protein
MRASSETERSSETEPRTSGETEPRTSGETEPRTIGETEPRTSGVLPRASARLLRYRLSINFDLTICR